MGHQFIRQPNGKWAIWSSIADDFIWLDCEPWDLFAVEAYDRVQNEYYSCKREIESMLDPEGRRRFTQMDWEEALPHRRGLLSKINDNEGGIDQLFKIVSDIKGDSDNRVLVDFAAKVAKLIDADQVDHAKRLCEAIVKEFKSE